MAVGDPYVSRTILKSVLGITQTDEDDLIDRALAGATRAINNRAGRWTFWKTATAETRTIDVAGKVLPRGGAYPRTKVLVPDIASATNFAVAGFSTASLLPPDCFTRGQPATALSLPYGATFGTDGTLTITAFWGWPAVPDDITFACQLQAQRYYKRRGSPEGIAGSAEWGLVTVPRLDPDVRAIIDGGYLSPGIG